MQLRRLGESSLMVSEIGLGTMTWGEQTTAADAHAQIEWALDHEINLIDTAEMYPVPPCAETQGTTERFIGTWLARHRGRRDAIVLASKIAGPGRRDWIRNGDTQVSARTIAWAIDDSLARLATDYIDLFQIHWPDRYVPMFGTWAYDVARERTSVPMLEQLEAMARAIAAGKIRAWGLSNETTYGVCEFWRLAREHDLPGPVSIQNCYNLVARTFDGDLAEASHRLNIPLLAYSPLAMGLLTGKYDGGVWPDGARLTRYPHFGERYRRPRVFAAAAAYNAIARASGWAAGALALAFVRGRPFVASALIGAREVAQLDEMAAWFGFELDAALDAAIAGVHAEYPSPSAF
jgi:aryl-alcohol dehydrogenase (NADP+)